MARLESLQLHSRHRLVGRFGGEHSSKRYGSTVDFADFREYHPGDDFRRIDYHVLARLDQVLIKLFEADDEVTVRILIDTSASMAVEGKLDQAKRLAAALGFVAFLGWVVVTGTRHDAGDKLGYLRANLAYALKRPELRADVLALCREMLDTAGR